MRYPAKGPAVVGVLLFIACTRVVGAQLPSADDILKKCLASYDAAKTFQGEVKFAKIASTGRSEVTICVKAENDGNGMVARSSLLIAVAGGELTEGLKTQQIIDDGTKVFVVHPDQKQYAIGPHAPDRVSGILRRSLDEVQRLAGTFAVNVRPVNGRSVYTLTSKFTDGTARILIDQASFHLQSVHLERGKPSARDISDLHVLNQVFDKPIPAEVFVWKAPAGFTASPPDGVASP